MRQDPEALPHRPESAPDNPDTSARKGSPRQFSRRKFVRTAGGVLIATGFGASCGDNAAGPVDTGSLRVVISGLSEVDSGRNGGEVTLTALEVEDFDPQKETLPASGDTGELAGFPVGRYRLEYEPPTGHVLATCKSASQDIEVTIDTLTTVE